MFAPRVAKSQIFGNAGSTRQRLIVNARPLGSIEAGQTPTFQRGNGNRGASQLALRTSSSLTRDDLRRLDEPDACPGSLTGDAATWDFSKIPLFPPDRPDQPEARTPF